MKKYILKKTFIPNNKLYNDVTIMIKTFYRPSCIIKCIKIIKHYYPDNKIIVADDSPEPLYKNNYTINNITWYTMPFDSGNSAGRILLLSKITTKYFVYLDDDYILSQPNLLNILYDCIENTNFDIICTSVESSINTGTICDYTGIFNVKDNKLYINFKEYHNIVNYKKYKIYKVDIASQCFIANTDIVKKTRPFIKELKTGEHHAFFISCYLNKLNLGVIKHIYATNGLIEQNKSLLNKYTKYRYNRKLDNGFNNCNIFQKKFNIKEIILNKSWTKLLININDI